MIRGTNPSSLARKDPGGSRFMCSNRHNLNESPRACRRASLPSRIQSKLQTADPGRGTAPQRYDRIPNPEIRIPNPESRIPKPETRNPRPESLRQEAYRWDDTRQISCTGIKQGDAFRSWLHYGAAPSLYLTERAYKAVWQKVNSRTYPSIFLCIRDNEGQIDGVVRELSIGKRL